MAHYLLFIETTETNPRKILDEAHCGELIDENDRPHVFDCMAGPNGNAGKLVLPHKVAEINTPDEPAVRNPKCGYFPDEQVWHSEPLSGRYWVGWGTDAPPTPLDLMRQDTTDGIPLEFNGQVWEVPHLMRTRRFVKMTANGPQWTNGEPDPVQAERGMWALNHMLAMFKAQERNKEPHRDLETEFNYSANVLGINYRINPFIAGCLELFDEQALIQTMTFSTDYQRLLALQEDMKKKESASTSPTP